MPPEERTPMESPRSPFIPSRIIRLLEIMEGDCTDPFQETKDVLRELLQYIVQQEATLEYEGGLDEILLRDLIHVRDLLCVEDPYPLGVKQSLLTALDQTLEKLRLKLRMHEFREARIRQYRTRNQEATLLTIGVAMAIPEGNMRDDEMLRSFLILHDIPEDLFDGGNEIPALRQMLTGYIAYEPWTQCFACPQDLARAFHRRRWMTDAQLEALLEEW
jgi:hypothetical protein